MTETMSSPEQRAMRLKWSCVFFLIMYAFMMLKASWLSDPDVYWHVVVGQDILKSGSLPSVDSYSFSAHGKPWIAKEWLSQVIFAMFYRVGGWGAISFLACAVSALSLTLLFWRFLTLVKWTAAVGIVWIAMPYLSLSLLARPLIFSFLFFALSLIEIESATAEKRRPAIWIVLVAILWANLHASFPILLVLLALGAADVALHAAPHVRLRLVFEWILIGFAVFIGFGCTPYAYESFRVSTAIVDADLSKYILEWRPIEFHFFGENSAENWILSGWLSFMTLGSLLILYRRREWWSRAMPLLLFAGATIKHIRFCTMLTLVAAVMVARPIGQRFQYFAPRALSTSVRAQKFLRMAMVTSLALALASFAIIDTRPVKSMSPEAALSFARAMYVEGHVYNSYAFGGFLIANNVPTLIDGRAELFFGGPFRTILDPLVNKDRDGFVKSLATYKVDWALVRTDSTEAKFFADLPYWSHIYSDDIAEVFVRIGPVPM